MRPKEHHLRLSSEEREALAAIVEKESPAKQQRARALLLADEGEHGPTLSFKQISEELGCAANFVSQLVARSAKYGAIGTAIGHHVEGSLKPRGITPEMDEALAKDHASGKFTYRELARRHGVSKSSVQRMLKRAGRE